ncbi:MAG: hypothetical protein AAGJ83_05665 [Planctomycetota bacterium]
MKHIALATICLSVLAGDVSAKEYRFGNSILGAQAVQVDRTAVPMQAQPLVDPPHVHGVTPRALPLNLPSQPSQSMQLSLKGIPPSSNMPPSLNAMRPRSVIAMPVISQHDASLPEPTPQPIMTRGESQQTMSPTPNRSSMRSPRAKKKQTVFEKLMEMERKKNAWLKRKFLGK